MAKSNTVTLEKLPQAIKDVLDEYADEINDSIPEVTRAVGRKGLAAIKTSSKVFKGTGEYAKGWRLNVENKRLTSDAIIHNKKLPGLPHLLEHGHANRDGGRTEGKVHIAPVEKILVEEFERKLIDAVK